MNIEEIQGAGDELKRLIHQSPYDGAGVARQLHRWRSAGLLASASKQMTQAVEDLEYDLSLIRQGSGSGDGRSHDQIVEDAYRRIGYITTDAFNLNEKSQREPNA